MNYNINALRFKILTVILISFFGVSFGQNASSTKESTMESSVIILFRHAETIPPPYEESPPNPKLSEAGNERAQLLASMLKDYQPSVIYSTNLNRTKETAELIRKAWEMELTFYGLNSMKDIAESMKANPGTYIVSGHSNTTPDMVKLLGGDPGPPVNENEYDRLYIVTISDGKATTVMLRYGNPYVKK